MLESIEILKLSQQKEKGTFRIRTKLSYYKVFHRISVSNRNKKTSDLMNKRVYLGFSILELTKMLMYEFWYDYVNPKYCEKAKLCYVDTDSFIVYVKTDDIYKEIEEDLETRYDTSNYELDWQLPKVKNRKVIGLMKNDLGGKIMTKFVRLKA